DRFGRRGHGLLPLDTEFFLGHWGCATALFHRGLGQMPANCVRVCAPILAVGPSYVSIPTEQVSFGCHRIVAARPSRQIFNAVYTLPLRPRRSALYALSLNIHT